MWTRKRHAEARAEVEWKERERLVSMESVYLSEVLDELERYAKEVAYLWTAGNITPNPALELAYAVWEQKRCVAEGTRT